MAAPTAIMAVIEKRAWYTARPKLRIPVNIAVIAASMMVALPCAVGIFPQRASIKTADMDSRFHSLVDSKREKITEVYFNKGL